MSNTITSSIKDTNLVVKRRHQIVKGALKLFKTKRFPSYDDEGDRARVWL